jgi:hypothetical protein
MNQTIKISLPKNMETNPEELSRSEKKPVSDLVGDSISRYITISRFRKL